MKTRILAIETPEERKKILEAVRAIESGGLVVIPTETVYGIAARAQKDTLELLDKVKGRPEGKHYTVHIGDLSQLAAYIHKLSLPAEKLVNHLWPGPLTMVFELNTKDSQISLPEIFHGADTIGIRWPDHQIASSILKEAVVPIVVPSANLSGQEPAVTFEKAVEYLDGKVDIIIQSNGQTCQHKKSSTVVKVGTSGIQILREGAISRDEIFRKGGIGILFVCTGNTCRSPMAEAICKNILSDKTGCPVDDLPKIGYKVESAGIAAFDGMRESPEVEVVCREFGIPFLRHRSRQVTSDMIRHADLVYVMSRAHADACVHLAPGIRDRIQLLDPDQEIPDPVGFGKNAYQMCFKQMEPAIRKRICERL